MVKILLFDEFAKGKYKDMVVNLKDNVVKVGKKRLIRFSQNKVSKEGLVQKIGKPIVLYKRTLLGEFIGLNLRKMILCYRTSYCSNVPIPWGETVEGKFDSEMYAAMSREDSIKELLSVGTDFKDFLIYIAAGAGAGFILAVVLIGQGLI